MEDRLNPVPPEGADEGTLGGYAAVHGRAPGFEGSDGSAYTAAIEVEPADDGSDEWTAYIVFLRWAPAGSAIMGHVETGDLARGATRDEAIATVEALRLQRVKAHLEEAIARRRAWDEDAIETDPDGGDRIDDRE